MFTVSLKMIKIDRNVLELWQIVCKNINFNISAFAGFIMFIVYCLVTYRYGIVMP